MEDFKEIQQPEPEVEKPKRKRSFTGFFIKSLLVILLLGSGFIWWKYFYTYSDGYRTGILQKLSHKGNFMKTYEGELIMIGANTPSDFAISSEKFYFSVSNDSIAKALMNFEGQKLKLHYQQKKGILPWRGESEYIIDGYEELERNVPFFADPQ